MTRERCAMLERTGCLWYQREVSWTTMFQELASCKDKHGHCKVPRGKGYLKLCRWLLHQTGSYKKKKKNWTSEMEERFQHLEDLGVVFKTKRGRVVGLLQRLPDFKAAHGPSSAATALRSAIRLFM